MTKSHKQGAHHKLSTFNSHLKTHLFPISHYYKQLTSTPEACLNVVWSSSSDSHCIMAPYKLWYYYYYHHLLIMQRQQNILVGGTAKAWPNGNIGENPHSFHKQNISKQLDQKAIEIWALIKIYSFLSQN